MAVQDRYTLERLKAYAREEFPLAFEAIADPNVYKFESCRFCIDSNGTQEKQLLHVAFWDSQQLNIRALMLIESPFPDERTMWMNTFQGPFAHMSVLMKPHSLQREEVKQMRQLTKKRVGLLVALAYLVTGRVTRINSSAKRDLLVEVRDLCIDLYKNELAKESLSTSSSISNTEGRSIRPEPVPSQKELQVLSPPEMSREGSSVNLVADRHKRQASTDDTPTVINSQAQITPPKDVRSGRRGLQIRSRRNLGAGKEAYEQKVRTLEVQLADEQKKAREAQSEAGQLKERYETLKGKVAKLMGDD
ncbi:hypothetical protein OPT61_g338 [Boeremia exigua]|uniref:Uncharacterized protein n=1 Tax=Boeremia exigua TaxID=749465 RepID=A0ACC2IUB0_9PLEO|nr:hypothetical protein OPT61_g338 [Boeremia exigua]